MTQETMSVDELKERALYWERLWDRKIASTGIDDIEYRRQYEHFRNRWYAAEMSHDD